MKTYNLAAYKKRLPPFIAEKLVKEMRLEKAFSEFGLKDFSVLSETTGFDGGEIDMEMIADDVVGSDIRSAVALCNVEYLLGQLRKNVSKTGRLVKAIVDERKKVIFPSKTAASMVIKDIRARASGITDKNLRNQVMKQVANFSIKPLKVIFSTDPWDIATMSMRGIHSCMRWGTHQSHSLVGSILCPYTAVIYSTDGTKVQPKKYERRTYQMGERMIHRAVVRIVSDCSTGKRRMVFMEEPYPQEEYGSNQEGYELLSKTLLGKIRKSGKKLSNKTEIFHEEYNTAMIPSDSVDMAILATNGKGPSPISYSDAELTYGHSDP